MISLIKLFGEKPNYKDALQGVWGYEGKENYYLTISKGVAHLETPIVRESVELKLKLPSCYDFYAQINGENGCRFVRVSDSELHIELFAGEQLNTNFKLK